MHAANAGRLIELRPQRCNIGPVLIRLALSEAAHAHVFLLKLIQFGFEI
jgi:hypothetical protein